MLYTNLYIVDKAVEYILAQPDGMAYDMASSIRTNNARSPLSDTWSGETGRFVWDVSGLWREIIVYYSLCASLDFGMVISKGIERFSACLASKESS